MSVFIDHKINLKIHLSISVMLQNFANINECSFKIQNVKEVDINTINQSESPWIFLPIQYLEPLEVT